MPPTRLHAPTPEETVPQTRVELGDWFSAPPLTPEDVEWLWLTPERSKAVWRLSKRFRQHFDFLGDWFSASRDRPEAVADFQGRVLAAAGPEMPVFVFHGRHGHSAVAYTTVGGFLDCWPRLRLLEEEHRGYDVLAVDLSFWIEVAPTGTAYVASRAEHE